MKTRSETPVTASKFTMRSFTDLYGRWQESGHFDLHQCFAGRCAGKGVDVREDAGLEVDYQRIEPVDPNRPRHHWPLCLYRLLVDPTQAVKSATALNNSLHSGLNYDKEILAKAKGLLPAVTSEAQLLLTVSWLTDPVTIDARGGLGNGRHRIAALWDVGYEGEVPVLAANGSL